MIWDLEKHRRADDRMDDMSIQDSGVTIVCVPCPSMGGTTL